MKIVALAVLACCALAAQSVFPPGPSLGSNTFTGTQTIGTTLPAAPAAPCNVTSAWAANLKIITPQMCGAKGDTRLSDTRIGGTGGSMSSSTNPTFLTCSDCAFTAADVGKIATVVGAGAAGVVLRATISSVTSSTVAVLGTAASTTVASARVSIGTDDTAAFTSAVAAASSGYNLYMPGAYYSINPSGVALSGGFRMYGDTPKSVYTAGTPADFSILPTGGTWLDCGGGTCFTGSGLRGMIFEYFGVMNFNAGAFVFGGDGLDGISDSVANFVLASGNAPINSSDTAWNITNMEHFNVRNLMAYAVNTGFHLMNKNQIQGFNSEWNNIYAYGYTKSVANSNATKPEVWIENLQPTIGTAASLSSFVIRNLQTNSYSGDGTNNHILVKGLNSSSPAIVELLDMDIEGAALAGVNCQYCNNSTFSFLGVSALTNTILFDTNSIFNTSTSNYNTSSAAGAGTTGCEANHNLFYGHWNNTALCGMYEDSTSGVFRANVDYVVANQKITVGNGTASGGNVFKVSSSSGAPAGAFTPRKGDDSADAPITAPSVGTNALSTQALCAFTNDGVTPVFCADSQNRQAQIYGPLTTNKTSATPAGGYRIGDSNDSITADSNNLMTFQTFGGLFLFKNSNGGNSFHVSMGAGSPNSVVSGSPGDLYLNISGGAATTLYVKESGSATTTGWVGK